MRCAHSNEYLIFQKIIKLEYEFPEKFFPKAKDLVKQLLVGATAVVLLHLMVPRETHNLFSCVFCHRQSLDPMKRLGCEEMGGYEPLKQHSFFDTISWSDLDTQTPPKLTPYLPAMSEDDEDCYGNVGATTIKTHTGRTKTLNTH